MHSLLAFYDSIDSIVCKSEKLNDVSKWIKKDMKSSAHAADYKVIFDTNAFNAYGYAASIDILRKKIRRRFNAMFASSWDYANFYMLVSASQQVT